MSNYKLSSPIDIFSSSTNAQINLFNTGGTFASQFQAPAGLVANVDFTLPTTAGTVGQFLQRTGAASLGLTTITTTTFGLPISIRTYQNSTLACTTATPVLQSVTTFYFPGSVLLGGSPTAAYIIFQPSSAATTCQARISDLTNATTIATVTSGTFPINSFNLINLGVLSNIPAGEAIWMLSFARPAGGVTAILHFFKLIF